MLIEQLSKEQTCVAGLKLAHNVGHQQALWAGLEYVSGGDYDAIVSIDADLQDDVNAIIEMVERHKEGADVVFGIRKERKTDTFFKKNTAQLFYRLMRTMGGEIVYNHADFR
uniref:CAZy families GT2 protein n=1 Tax=uncultured Geobacillus sp. TaxID=228952 RepID=A0A060C2C1_9BACL|nr:CAZy families GT2 protein [uncultured Geobacillus sp.]